MADIYMRNIRDWRDSTLMLSFEEKGYFDELLNLIYIYDDCLADNDELICRAMPVNKKRHLRLKEKLLKAGLIAIKDGFYFNKRASQEIDKINQISEKNKVKANKRWAKSRITQQKPPTAAHNGAHSAVMQNVKVNSEEYLLKKTKVKKSQLNERPKNVTKKCSLEDIIDVDGKIPAEYREFAITERLENIDRVFWSWANWWVGEDGRKAGARGWFNTWKARVLKDVQRQNVKTSNKIGRSRQPVCSTTLGAKNGA